MRRPRRHKCRHLIVPPGRWVPLTSPGAYAGGTGRPTGGVAMPDEPTVLRVLITGPHWQNVETFEAQFKKAAVELAGRNGEPRLRTVTVSRRQFERWYAGKVKTGPHPDSCRVLEHMFGCAVHQLLGSASQATSQITHITPVQEEALEPAVKRLYLEA